MDSTKSTGLASVEIPHVWMKLGEDGEPEKVLDQGNNIALKMWQNYRQCDPPAEATPAILPMTAKKEGV